MATIPASEPVVFAESSSVMTLRGVRGCVVWTISLTLGLLIGFVQLELMPTALWSPLIYAPVGVSLALAVLLGVRVLPVLAVAGLATALLHGETFLSGLGNALAVLTEASVGLMLWRRHGSVPRLDRSRDLFLLVFGITGPAAATAVIVRLGFVQMAAVPFPPEDPLLIGPLGWLTCWLITLIVVPAALAFSSETLDTERIGWPERLVWLGSAVLISQFAISIGFEDVREGPIAFALFAVLAGWTAYRYEVPGAAILLLIAALVALINGYFGSGPLAMTPMVLTRLSAVSLVSLIVVFLLLLSAVVSENRNAVRERQFLVLELQARQASLEAVNGQLLATTHALRDQAREIDEKGRHLGEIVRRLPVGVLITDATGRPVQGNDQLEAIFGRPFVPDDLPALDGVLHRVLKTGQAMFDQEILVERSDGSRRVVQTSAVPLTDATGQVTAGLLTLHDITEHRQLEEQLTQAAKLEAIGLLAGGIAHDFNNLLTAVLGGLSMVELRENDPNRETLHAVERAAHGASDLASKLLRFARRQHLEFGPVRADQVIDETVAILRRTLDPRIRIHARNLGTPVMVMADSSQLQSIVFNLCVNARDAMDDGGDLTIDLDTMTVHADDSVPEDVSPGEYVRLSVEDTGTGMPPEVQARLFEPFFTTKPVGRGTGLGMALIQGFVRQQHGWITVRSEPGTGTRFDIHLPAAPSEVSPTPGSSLKASEPTAMNAARPPVPGTVLVVEDEESVRLLARLILTHEGYEVLTASDGPEAVSLFRERAEQIDLVVLDQTLPTLSGAETFRRLQQYDPDVRVLFCSGYAYDLNADCAGAVGFLPKPFERVELVRAVRSAIEHPCSVGSD